LVDDKVMATKVYTSGEFKRERDNFLSLCKNLERADTKRWLSEVSTCFLMSSNVKCFFLIAKISNTYH
jgi:hypothetical protein